jgi:hypothetical protein
MEYSNYHLLQPSRRASIFINLRLTHLALELKSCVEPERFRTITGPDRLHLCIISQAQGRDGFPQSSDGPVVEGLTGNIPETFFPGVSHRGFLTTGGLPGLMHALRTPDVSFFLNPLIVSHGTHVFYSIYRPAIYMICASRNQSAETCSQSADYKAGTYR